nr:MAG TPA: hypothetical protein [Caudoviricetes sp.]
MRELKLKRVDFFSIRQLLLEKSMIFLRVNFNL